MSYVGYDKLLFHEQVMIYYSFSSPFNLMKCNMVTTLNHKYAMMLFVSNGMFPQVSAWLLSSQPSQNGAYVGREGDAKSCEDAIRRSTCSYSYPVTWTCSAYGFYWKGRLACSKT